MKRQEQYCNEIDERKFFKGTDFTCFSSQFVYTEGKGTCVINDNIYKGEDKSKVNKSSTANTVSMKVLRSHKQR